ncbi:DNA-binding protein [Capnocytophaga cynodegmi]|uniref:YceD family protein n=1 Tax=Capnocytophaga cynodegmi TaxID=28189 RepID=UPI001AD2AB80|nr:DUF177 domain-containing protein [Capnocytophaga cynodegmi]GIM53098.1 DNA-binding protein [Capnocytophaga cynodegmi]
MRKLKEYDISFAGLKQGKHQFVYEVDKKFLDSFGYDDVNNLHQVVTVELDKKSTLLELHFRNEGVVNVNCDLSNEPFDMKVEGELFLVVKFGEEYNDEDDELLILPHGEHLLNVAQYIYELIVLSMPVKRVHPEVEKGTLHSDILDKLEELTPKEELEESEYIDPRWESLKKIIITDKEK